MCRLDTVGHLTERNRPPDPFSEVLAGLMLQSWISGGLVLTVPWGLRAGPGLGWFYLPAGEPCAIEVEDENAPVSVGEGDLVVIVQGHGHTLRDAAGSPAVAIERLFEPSHFERREELRLGGGGPVTKLFCGCFAMDGLERSPWYAALPPLIHVRAQAGAPQSYVDYIIRLIMQEVASDELCAPTVINRLVRILFIKAVSSFMSSSRQADGHRLKALIDPDIGRALGLMHRQPDVGWTVALLAERVTMSRSAFAARFTEMVGQPPMEYLTECRMQKACWLLRAGRSGLKQVATEVGYESAAAFSKAFSRWAGVPPGTYRHTIGPGIRVGYSGMPPI